VLFQLLAQPGDGVEADRLHVVEGVPHLVQHGRRAAADPVRLPEQLDLRGQPQPVPLPLVPAQERIVAFFQQGGEALLRLALGAARGFGGMRGENGLHAQTRQECRDRLAAYPCLLQAGQGARQRVGLGRVAGPGVLPAPPHAVDVLRDVRQEEEGAEGPHEHSLLRKGEARQQYRQRPARWPGPARSFSGTEIALARPRLPQAPGQLSHLLHALVKGLAMTQLRWVPGPQRRAEQLPQQADIGPQRRLRRLSLSLDRAFPPAAPVCCHRTLLLTFVSAGIAPA
jgi:hypothetical protein